MRIREDFLNADPCVQNSLFFADVLAFSLCTLCLFSFLASSSPPPPPCCHYCHICSLGWAFLPVTSRKGCVAPQHIFQLSQSTSRLVFHHVLGATDWNIGQASSISYMCGGFSQWHTCVVSCASVVHKHGFLTFNLVLYMGTYPPICLGVLWWNMQILITDNEKNKCYNSCPEQGHFFFLTLQVIYVFLYAPLYIFGRLRESECPNPNSPVSGAWPRK